MSSPTADVSVRVAWSADADDIAGCQVRTWRHEYAGVLPAETLGQLDTGVFADKWADSLDRPGDARNRVLVALERAAVRGFAVTAPCADPDADPVADGEIAELAVDPEFRGQGHGSRLVQACTDTMRADGFSRAVWWLPTTDDSLRAFVTGTGWEADGAHRELDLAGDGSATFRQVRLHTTLVDPDS